MLFLLFSFPSSLTSQAIDSSTSKNLHNPKTAIEQRKRIGNQSSHRSHPADRTEHPTRTVRTPNDRQTRQNVPQHSVHRYDDPDQTRQHQRQ